jgi:DNA mismatch endonuclease (patch repair protein)
MTEFEKYLGRPAPQGWLRFQAHATPDRSRRLERPKLIDCAKCYEWLAARAILCTVSSRTEKSSSSIRSAHSETRDIVSHEQRSRMMRAVGQKQTAPERAVASILRHAGIRYRLNNRSLPGSPDLSNQRRGWAIFVHGCFWHGHRYCQKTKGGPHGRVPATRPDFWEAKLVANRLRDRRKSRQLRASGLRVLTVWECELRNREKLAKRVECFVER